MEESAMLDAGEDSNGEGEGMKEATTKEKEDDDLSEAAEEGKDVDDKESEDDEESLPPEKREKATNDRAVESPCEKGSEDGKTWSASSRSEQEAKEGSPSQEIEEEAGEEGNHVGKENGETTAAAKARSTGRGITDTLLEFLLKVGEMEFSIKENIIYDERTNRYTEPGAGKQRT